MLSTNLISYNLFQKTMLVIGKAMHVEVNNSAKVPAYYLSINFGLKLSQEHEETFKKQSYFSSAQLCSNHKIEDLTHKQMMCVLNFPRKQIGKKLSDCLVTGVQDFSLADKRSSTVFLKPTKEVKEGSRINVTGEEEIIEKNPRNLNWEEFASLDFRIATIVAFQENFFLKSKDLKQGLMEIDMGLEKYQTCVGLFKQDFDTTTLLGKQVLIIANLALESISEIFSANSANVVLCSISGDTFLEPAIKVNNGYKLA